ncbi:MAG: response regulator transcription factor [Nevskia sp.]|nr:response regulator transcription factor [Nevskia sp.]
MRLLLIEDDRMIGAAVQRGLREEGFSVDWIDNGVAAETACREPGYDAAVLDLGLPDKDGLSLLSVMRRAGNALPVIVLTARDTVSERIRGLDSGADDYLGKPFDLNELAARVRALVRRRSGRATPLIEHAGLQLNPATREVRLHGEPLALSAREFALLEILAARPGNVLSRGQIEDKLYGWGEEIGSNTVEVYIHLLRRKLGHDFIRNVRGVGYMIPAVS